ncbi:hypothetical protein FIBSPDRAFT_944041 [Athelia psychrophila]|uniref:Uncharacterized protein n=1 Tax=Athelia psychrophila TaxID=1759441 RepID=A0A166V9F8_9AGAM|nr:hypothetical protein FIBSPDRAFT_944041 [Fibularhizoctonia sp. CBS 109695]
MSHQTRGIRMETDLDVVRTGPLMHDISPEILESICVHCSLPSVLMMGATSNVHRTVTQSHIVRRSRSVVRPYVSQPDRMFILLDWTASIISGSIALQFMLGTDMSWVPSDLDIYTPNERSRDILETFLRLEGFSSPPPPCISADVSVDGIDQEIDPDGEDGGDDDQVQGQTDPTGIHYAGQEARSIVDVTRMSKGSLSVDLIVSAGRTALIPVLHFHSTVVMNYLSGSGFFSAYPVITDRGMSLINPLSFYPRAAVPPKVLSCLVKYATRGFSVFSSPSQWEAHPDPFASDTVNKAYSPHNLKYAGETVEFPRSVDPKGVLANMAGDNFVHIIDNEVDYTECSVIDGGRNEYKPKDPATLKIGDIIEVRVSFVIIPSRGGGHAMQVMLRI